MLWFPAANRVLIPPWGRPRADRGVALGQGRSLRFRRKQTETSEYALAGAGGEYGSGAQGRASVRHLPRRAAHPVGNDAQLLNVRPPAAVRCRLRLFPLLAANAVEGVVPRRVVYESCSRKAGICAQLITAESLAG
jgi:hypothetical protein